MYSISHGNSSNGSGCTTHCSWTWGGVCCQCHVFCNWLERGEQWSTLLEGGWHLRKEGGRHWTGTTGHSTKYVNVFCSSSVESVWPTFSVAMDIPFKEDNMHSLVVFSLCKCNNRGLRLARYRGGPFCIRHFLTWVSIGNWYSMVTLAVNTVTKPVEINTFHA